MPAKKPHGHSRSSIVRIRFTPDEFEAVASAASSRGVTLSALVRHLTLGSELPKQPPPKVDQETYRELGHIGNNLNQIAKRLNSPHGPSPGEAEIRESIVELQATLKKIRLGVLQ